MKGKWVDHAQAFEDGYREGRQFGIEEVARWVKAREGKMNKETMCSARVDFDTWRTSQCSRKAVVDRDGKPYCKIHDPEYIKAKRAKSQAKYDSKCCPKCKGHLSTWWTYCPSCGTKVK